MTQPPIKLLVTFVLLLCMRQLTYAQSADSLLQQGIELYNHGDYEKSIVVFEGILGEAKAKKDNKSLAVIYNNLGNAHSNIGKQVEALKYYQHAVQISEQLGDKKRTAKTLKNIGTLYEEQNNLTAALKQYNKAEAIATEIQDSSTIADCANNKGVVYEVQKDYRSALVSYKKALAIYEKLKLEDRISITLNNLGIVYKYLGRYKEAIASYSEALTLSEKLEDKFMIAANYSNMANIYMLMHEYKKAIALNTKSLEIAREINAVNIIMAVYESMAECYVGLNDYATAYQYQQKFKAISDSTFNIEKASQLNELQTRYETVKKEDEIRSLKEAQQISELTLSKRNYQVIIALCVLVLVIIVAYFLMNRQRVRARHLREKEILETEHRERLRISKDMHDDLGSGLSKIAIMSELVKSRFNNETDLGTQVNKISATANDLVDKMSHIVWAMNPQNDSLDNLMAYMREFASDLFDDTGMMLSIDFPDDETGIRLNQETRRNVFMVVKESLNNILKHSHAGTITLTLWVAPGEVHMAITDNGKGFETGNTRRFGNGLINMKKRMEEINGAYTISSVLNEGTRTEISWPR